MKKLLFIFLSILMLSSITLSAHILSDKKIIGYVKGVPVNSITKVPINEPDMSILLVKPTGELIDSVGTYVNNQIRGRGIVEFCTYVYEKGDYKLIFIHEDYDTTRVDVNFNGKKVFLELGEIPVRKLTRAEKGVKLGEIVVAATKVKFYNKGDTIVYDADAFQLSNGSMLDGLIEQLPGAELRDDGRISVNGKFVQEILLNGKDFFQGDNKVALENLPAYMVKNVEVYDKQSDNSRMAGMKMDEGTFVMNIKLKKDYQAGWLANAEAGGGTKDRYMGRAFGLRFSPTSRVSVFGNVNNISDTRKPGRNGDWSPSDLTNGLATTKNGGVDYALFDERNTYDINGNVQATYTEGLYDARTSTQNFLSSGDTYGRGWSRSENNNLKLATRHQLEYYFGPGTSERSTIRLELRADYNKFDRKTGSVNGLFDAHPNDDCDLRDSIEQNHLVTMPWVNTSIRNNRSKGHTLSTNGNFMLFYKNPNSDDSYRFDVGGSYGNSTDESGDMYDLRFRQAPQKSEKRRHNSPSNKYQYFTKAAMFMVPAREWRIYPSYEFKKSYSNTTSDWYLLEQDGRSGRSLMLPSMSRAMAGLLDPENSYNMGVHSQDHNLRVDFAHYASNSTNDFKKQWSLTFNLTLAATYRIDNIFFNGVKTISKNRERWLPNPEFYMIWDTPGKNNNFSLRYQMLPETPSYLDLIDVEFTSDPLNIRTGNPDLRNTIHHRVRLNYTARQWAMSKEINLSAELGLSVWKNGTSMGYTYDPDLGIRYYRPENIDGNWWSWCYGWMSLPVSRDKRLRLTTYTRFDISESADFVSTEGQTGSQKQIVHSDQFMETLNLDYSIGRFRVGLNGRLQYRHSTSNSNSFRTINAADFKYGLTGLVKLPLSMELSTDISMFSRRGYSNRSMNTDDLVWNASLSKGVMNNNLTFTIEAFDILHQLSNIRYELNGMGRTETWVNCIPRYLMFKARYRLNIQPRKRK